MEHHHSFRKPKDDNGDLSRNNSQVSRKKSLIKPERRRLSKDDPGYYYTLAAEEGNVSTHPSSTGNDPRLIASNSRMGVGLNVDPDDRTPMVEEGANLHRDGSTLSRKHSYLARSDSRRSERTTIHVNRQSSVASRASYKSNKSARSGHSYLHSEKSRPHRSLVPELNALNEPHISDSSKNFPGAYNATSASLESLEQDELDVEPEVGRLSDHVEFEDEEEEIENEVESENNGYDEPFEEPYSSESETHWEPEKQKPLTSPESKFEPWKTYCIILTAPFVPWLLNLCGLKTKDRQMAWREKIGLISVILYCGLFVGYLTFGFTETVCKNTAIRIHSSQLATDELLISGTVYELGSYEHPGVTGIDDNSPILYPPVNAGGKDASFLFQNVNGNCKGVITPKENSSIPFNSEGEMGWYFPCQLLNLNNFTLVNNTDIATNNSDLYNGWACHTYSSARDALFDRKVAATVYYTWDDLWYNSTQQLVTYNGDVLNLDYLDFLSTDDLDYPEMFTKLKNDLSIRGKDISQEMSYGNNRKVINCLREITKVGEVDTDTIGCIASKVVLYISLVFIMGLVVIKFLLACYFRFFIARRQGAFPITETEFKQRERQIESWGDDIFTSAQNYQDFEHFPSPDASYMEMQQPNSPSIHSSSVSNAVGAQHEFPPPMTPNDTSTSSFRQAFAGPSSSGYMHSSNGPTGPVSGNSPFNQPSFHASTSSNFDRRPPSIAASLTDSTKRQSIFMEKIKGRPSESNRVSGVTMGTQHPSITSSKVLSGQSLQKHPLMRQSVYDRRSTMHSQYGKSSNTQFGYENGDGEMISMVDLPPPSFQSISRSANSSGKSSPTMGSPKLSLASPSIPDGPIGGNNDYLIPQPPSDYRPFGYPLIHVMCMVTAYSESIDGLRTTLDSICTTDYPNSHQLIAIVCDGLVKGSGNDMTTPEICLSMMTDFSIPVDEVEAHSYVSVVSGSKRHNMAKVYAGFYKYDDDTIPPEKQQRVPVICVVKCGTPQEADAAKPGNRGKRDSQIILMSFLQRVMFDERMTELEFELFEGIRSITGIAPDFYELLLMVDADTKVFPDCLTHMCAEMVKDPEIMGLCGETKIANKRDTWVTMIQVFEYFISHHQAKAFESVFGGVTCLPGCFSIYRIKAPKGAEGYWVPILCNPDIVERYSDNAINTLHSKNLLLLGEDRFLSTLMLRTFPKRKMTFVPKAACKTIVPDEFKVLLSQRRRWINSTIHNLFELLLVRDLCGVFIISMQFVVFVDLLSTLVLPAAISFTLYVVIIAIVKRPVPYLSLILLGMILGLPGLLIVVTATRASYLVWMLIYLAALPIWNFVLPMYAYWHFDDFSWGETRAVVGGSKAHDEAEGEFDSSQIKMLRWREFQAEREKQMQY